MNYKQIIPLIRKSLKEDIGKTDITTDLLIPEHKLAKASLLAKQDFIVCGLDICGLVFKLKDKKIRFKPKVSEGYSVKKGMVLAKIEGNARNILTAERVALNFLSLLSGIATKTKKYVDAIKPYKVKIMDTRKTIPGLRELQKYAVRIGGGFNHRMKLDEMILIKDNHLKVIDDRLRSIGSARFKTEIEVKTIKEFKNALRLKPDIIMLDNMSIKDMKKAVKIRNYRLPKLEASGNINLKNIKRVAATGVDMISVGALTHSPEAVDISLEIL